MVNAPHRPHQRGYMSIGQLIKKLRKERNITQLELARFSGVPFATINKLENDKSNATISTLERILDVFNYEISGIKKHK